MTRRALKSKPGLPLGVSLALNARLGAVTDQHVRRAEE